MRFLPAALFVFAGMLYCFPPDAAAELRIYLHSSAALNGEETLLEHLSSVDGDPADVQRVRALKIPPEMMRDGYFDRRELEELLGGTSCPLYIYGSAVRIKRSGFEENAASGPVVKATVKFGDAVAVRVKKNGVVLECTGSALGDGNEGDTVEVKIRGTKSLRGRLTRDKMVELEL